MELRTQALKVLCETDPTRKAEQARALYLAPPALDTELRLPAPHGLPGRPERPLLVPADQVPARSPFTPQGRAALLHAICHIEFNAINLALDALWRFPGMPEDFYRDWLQVAGEEALHFTLLREHLRSLGHDYGDFDAHDGLWQMAERTRDDVLARMALVPRLAEARGLDASPPIQAKLTKVGDQAGVALLDIILRDEIGHVSLGDKWFRYLCAEGNLPVEATYRQLMDEYQAPRPIPPMNEAARLKAGFSAEELAALRPTSATRTTPAQEQG